MAIELSLDTVDELAQEDYADILIPLPSGTVVTLVHPLRQSDEARQELATYFETLRAEDDEAEDDEAEAKAAKADSESILEQMRGLIRILVEDNADELFEALGDDKTRHRKVIDFYFEKANPGEA